MLQMLVIPHHIASSCIIWIKFHNPLTRTLLLKLQVVRFVRYFIIFAFLRVSYSSQCNPRILGHLCVTRSMLCCSDNQTDCNFRKLRRLFCSAHFLRSWGHQYSGGSLESFSVPGHDVGDYKLSEQV